jgi:hypothetical protein
MAERNNKVDSADIANVGWPLKCINLRLEFITTLYKSDDLV